MLDAHSHRLLTEDIHIDQPVTKSESEILSKKNPRQLPQPQPNFPVEELRDVFKRRRAQYTGINSQSPVERNGDKPRQLRSHSKQLKSFAKDGGPNLCDLRGYPIPSISKSIDHVMPSNQSSTRTESKSRDTLLGSSARTTTSKTKRTSAYDPNFEQDLIDNRIYPDDCDVPNGREPPKPKNQQEILEELQQPRASLSPSQFSEKAFRSFKQKNSRALNEDAVMGDVFPVIQGSARIPSAKNLVFGNLEPLTQGNFVDAKPDFYDGAHPAQIDSRIRAELGSYITPSARGQAPALPTLFAEVKGPEGSGAVAKRQACHNGVLGERGVRELMAFGMEDTETVYDDNAYTITSTYHSATGTLQMYTMHQTRAIDPGNSPEYYMTQLNTFAITGTAERFREGVGAFRNARDWAKKQRDGLIVAANKRVIEIPKETSTLDPSTHSTSQSTIGPDTVESETSADELSQNMGQVASLSCKRLKRESEKRASNSDVTTRSKKGWPGAKSRSRSRGRLLQSR